MEYRSGGLLFTSKFDSGNLARVERVYQDEDEDSGSHRIGDPCITPDFEFNVWTNPDCGGTEFENGNRTWFHFAIKGCPMNKLVKINIMNLNKQGKLYSQGMAPVVKVIPQKPKWERIRDRPTHESANGQFLMSFTYRFEYRFSAVFFAFCYPYSYAEYQMRLEELDSKFQNASKLSSNSPLNSIYYHRELLCYSRDRLRVDLVTISSCHGITSEEEPRLDRLFPDTETSRAKKFQRKRVFFLSSRVHPGETPASFVFNGFLDFVLRPKDPRAVQLRKQYVFKLVPLLNPDGVQRGHYRTDQRGVNLNRMYLNPDPDLHPSIFAAKSLIVHHHVHSRVKSQSVADKVTEPVQRPITGRSERQTVQRQSVHSATHSKAIQLDVMPQQDPVATDEDVLALDLDNFAENDTRKPTAIVMVHNGSEKPSSTDQPSCNEAINGVSPINADCAAGGDVGVPSGDASAHCTQSLVNGTAMHSLGGQPDGYQESRPLSSLTRDASLEESDGEDGDLCQKTSSLTLADTTVATTPVTPCFSEEDLLSIPPHESGIAFYVDLHGHASKRGCFIYGNHLNLVDEQVENLLYPKLISMNSAYFDFDGCNFTEKNMYTKDKRDGMTKEGSGRVAVYKATGIIHSYTLECNYNTGRFMNSMSPATRDDGRATPPPLAGFPPKYTIAHYEEVGRAVAVAALDMTDTNPWSRIASTDYVSVHGVRGWVQRYLRSMKGAPKLPNKMSRVASKTSSIVASATSHTGMHTRARQALSDTSIHQTANQSGHSTVTSNHGNNNSNRKPTISRHLGPVRETRASLERKKRLAQVQSSQPTTSYNNPSPSSYTINTPAPCSSSSHSPINLTFSSGVNQTKPISHGAGQQGKPQALSLTHKNLGSLVVNNSNIQGHGTSVKSANSKVQPASHRMPPKGSKKVVEELLHHMVVNSLDGLKKTSNKDAETARLQGETRPLGQPAGEARLLGHPPKSPVGQRGFQPANKKKVGGAKGDVISKSEKANLVSPKRRRRKAASFRRSSSHSPSRKSLLHRKSSETDSEGDFKNMLVKTRASTIASSFSDPCSSTSERQDSNSTVAKHLHPQSEKIQMSPRRRSTGGSTPEAPYLRPHMDHVTMSHSVTTRSLSPSATISCQLLDLNAIQSIKPIKNTNYWTEN